jgi:hypothetical protein
MSTLRGSWVHGVVAQQGLEDLRAWTKVDDEWGHLTSARLCSGMRATVREVDSGFQRTCMTGGCHECAAHNEKE